MPLARNPELSCGFPRSYSRSFFSNTISIPCVRVSRASHMRAVIANPPPRRTQRLRSLARSCCLSGFYWRSPVGKQGAQVSGDCAHQCKPWDVRGLHQDAQVWSGTAAHLGAEFSTRQDGGRRGVGRSLRRGRCAHFRDCAPIRRGRGRLALLFKVRRFPGFARIGASLGAFATYHQDAQVWGRTAAHLGVEFTIRYVGGRAGGGEPRCAGFAPCACASGTLWSTGEDEAARLGGISYSVAKEHKRSVCARLQL
jgi:hypothetical protein